MGGRRGISRGGLSRFRAFNGTEQGIAGPERGQGVESREGGGLGQGAEREQRARLLSDEQTCSPE